MKKLSLLILVLFVCMPATALADLAPLPTKCEDWCVPKCYNCETQVRSDSHECFEPCYGCSSPKIREMCNQYMSELEAQRAKEQAALAAEAERQAQEAAAAQQTKPLETKRSCTASPYAPSQAPIAMIIFCMLALGLIIPARRQK
ncbi:MAG: hypothetical protein II767_03865 [Proteobacteria bacterium]|nr:hypothetical protein [Pseudomonadota bacterium]